MSTSDKVIAALESDPERIETPCYAYDPQEVVRNHADLARAVGTPLLISFKANSCVELLLRYHHVAEDGIEVASVGELTAVAGSAGGRVYFNSPACDVPAMRAVIAYGATLVVDNPMQLETLASLPRRDRARPLMLRLNGGVLEAHGAPRVRGDHFGMDWDDARAAIRRIRELGLEIDGLHLFRGSHAFRRAGLASIPAVKAVIEAFRAETGHPPRLVNLGGGWSERWREDALDFAAYRKALAACDPAVRFVHESGRAIFASAGCFLTRVLYRKALRGQWVLVCDGGISHSFLLCNTEGAFRRYRTPEMWLAKGGGRPRLENPALLVGPSCSRDDVIGQLPQGERLPAPGDVLLFGHCGAYHYSYSVSRFLSLREAGEYVL